MERMMDKDPKERPTVFWTNENKKEFLKLVGKQEEVENFWKYNKPDQQKLLAVLDQCAEKGLFDRWKNKMRDELPTEVLKEMDKKQGRTGYPEHGFGLLRFIRNLYEHHAEAAAGIDLLKMFPGLFHCVLLFVKRQGWNTRDTLKKFWATSTHPREWNRISKRWSRQLEKLENTHEANDIVVKVGNVVMGKGDEFLIARGSNLTEVFLGLRDDGTEVAVKRMTKKNYEVLRNEKDFLRLPELDHPSIVRYVDFVEDENFGYLVLQLCEYTLEEYIKKGIDLLGGHLSEREIAQQVLTSLKILHHHTPPILHRDIKPQNVLIDVTRKARLADFGISRRLLRGQTTHFTSIAGTRCWMAKETIKEDNDDTLVPYKRSADIQVAGMLLYYILSRGHHPFGPDLYCEVNIFKGDYNLDRVPDVLAKNLIEKMINKDPEKRPRVEECLAHPYFCEKENSKERMMDEDPEERPTVEDCLVPPWDNEK